MTRSLPPELFRGSGGQNRIDLTGERFGNWTALHRAADGRAYHTRWACRCCCGVEKAVNTSDLRSGASTNCGCQSPSRRVYVRRSQQLLTVSDWNAGEFSYCGEPCLRDGRGAVAIPLSDGSLAWVDDSDFPLVAPSLWAPMRNRPVGTTYAVSAGRPATRMHRLVMGAAPGVEVDHRDRDGLNNRRGNLRPATRAQNTINRRVPLGRVPYRGVSLHKGRFVAQIGVKHKFLRLGQFATPEEAAVAYDAAAIIHHGEFAILNFPLLVRAA